MKQYPTYKNSGVQWIGQIPEHWNVCHLWWLLEHMTTGLNPRENFRFKEDGEYYYVTIANFKDGQLFLDEKCDRIDEEAWKIIQERSDLQKGDILFASISRNGQAYIVKEFPSNWNINESVFKLRFKKDVVDTNFAYYVLTDDSFYNEMQSEATGATFQSIKQNKLKLNTLPLPPLAEQQAIAQYLDSKTAKIDESISLYEQQKADLVEYRKALISDTVTRGLNPNAKLKESGIQWLGQIPTEWKIVPLKSLLRLLTDGTHQTPTYIESGVPFISIKDMSGGTIDFSDTKYISEEEHAILSQHAPVEKGDIIFSRIGTLGVFIKVDTDKVFDIFVSLGLMKIIEGSIDTDFLVYYLSSIAVKRYIDIVKAGEGTSAAKFNLTDVGRTSIVMPSLEEQQDIVAFLDAKTASIDEAIRRIDEQITDLRNYRTALITDAVTGKIDVR